MAIQFLSVRPSVLYINFFGDKIETKKKYFFLLLFFLKPIGASKSPWGGLDPRNFILCKKNNTLSLLAALRCTRMTAATGPPPRGTFAALSGLAPAGVFFG